LEKAKGEIVEEILALLEALKKVEEHLKGSISSIIKQKLE
jgi:hypothetical protein